MTDIRHFIRLVEAANGDQPETALAEARPSHVRTLSTTPWEGMPEVEAWLAEQGFEQVGHGTNATVWTNGGNIIVKVFQDDSCYASYAEYCRQNAGNPHLPKISRVIALPNRGGVVFMERLKPMARTRSDGLSIKLLRYTAYLRRNQFQDADQHPFCKSHPALAATIRGIMEFFAGRSCHYDVASTNIMRRGTTAVLTDPVTGE